jgi:hypothetical protein
MTEPAAALHKSDPPIRTWGTVFALVAIATLFAKLLDNEVTQASRAMTFLAAVAGRVAWRAPRRDK